MRSHFRSTVTTLNASRLVLILIIGALTARPASSQEWAKERVDNSPRHMEYVTVKHGDRAVECMIAFPEVSEKAQAVVIIHDISGFGDWSRSVADQLAEAGVIAIVPDLVSGMGPDGGGTASFKSVDEVRRAVSSLPKKQVTADLNAVAEHVAKLPACNGNVSVAGFCWGGGQCLRYATENPKLSAAYVFYGYEPVTAADIKRIACPVYGFYAENDARINASLPEVENLMKETKKTFEPVIYKNAGHGFMRQGEDPAGSEGNKKAREDGWKRWKQLLAAAKEKK
jgi:carboxymethylenebutenolidase